MDNKTINIDTLLNLLTSLVLEVCLLTGYTSYVNNEGDRGSIFITELVNVLTEHSHNQDVNTILTWVHRYYVIFHR